jgi:hypothetical protein
VLEIVVQRLCGFLWKWVFISTLTARLGTHTGSHTARLSRGFR